MAIYHEARSEPLVGQVAVGYVVMNRVRSPEYPDDVCSVVTQARQFSFRWLPPRNTGAWEQAVLIGERLLAGDPIVDPTGGALHYHRDDVAVNWTSGMAPSRIGDRHIFWRGRGMN
jgi:spore germination cell wall hydrolase CwlJ-like protein